MGEQYPYQTADPQIYGLLKAFAAKNKAFPTRAESLVWNYLRANQMGVRYHRQHIIGNYIADFACLSLNLIIEIDGLYHSLPEQQIRDEERTNWLENNGFKVVRFTNDDILYNLENVLERIKDEQNKRQR